MGEEDQEPDHAYGSILRQPGLKSPLDLMTYMSFMVGDLATAIWTKLCLRYS